MLVVYRTPVRAGVSTAFYNNVRRAVSPKGEAKLAALHANLPSAHRFGQGVTTLQTHMNMMRFFVSIAPQAVTDTAAVAFFWGLLPAAGDRW